MNALTIIGGLVVVGLIAAGIYLLTSRVRLSDTTPSDKDASE